MKINKLYLIVALLGTVLAGCQKEQEVIKEEKLDETQNTEQGWTLTVKASLGVDTKALGLDNNGMLVASWAENEVVAVYFGSGKVGELTVTDVNDDEATLSGKVTNITGIDQGSVLTLLFPGREDEKWTYEGQNGSVPNATSSLSKEFDYETATLTVDAVGASEITLVSDEVTFQTEQSVFSFGFKIGEDYDAIQSVIIGSKKDKIAINRSFSAGSWTTTEFGAITVIPASNHSGDRYYVALRHEYDGQDDAFYFTVTGSDHALYLGSRKARLKTGETTYETIGNGKYIQSDVTLTQKAVATNTTESVATAL